MNKISCPIGVFDSGIGGLSVANAIYRLMPQESIIYFADTARVPYGPRPKSEIQLFSEQITQFLLQQKVKIIVVACNTATAAALNELRKQHPEVLMVGMEPAVKPAAKATKTQNVGVLATLSTINSERYAQLMHRYAAQVNVFENPCIGLVPLIEQAKLNDSSTEALLRQILEPMLAQGIDTLVLGCTHYPFILPLLHKIIPEHIQIIDPAPAVALQTQRLLKQHQLLNTDLSCTPKYQIYGSGALLHLDHFSDIPFEVFEYSER